MGEPYRIVAARPALLLGEEGEGSLSFTVTNLHAEELLTELSLGAESVNEAWFCFEGPRRASLEVGEVWSPRLLVQAPLSAANREGRVHLIARAVEHPELPLARSASVRVQLSRAQPREPGEEPRARLLWPWVLLAIGLLCGLGAALSWALS